MSLRALLFFIVLCSVLSGCEENNVGSFTGEGDMLPYLSTMRYVTVSLEAYTRHYRYEKQSSKDPGNTTYFEGSRNYWFTNGDTTFTLEWIDSGFTSKSTFGVRQYTPFPIQNVYPKTSASTIAGFYDPVAKTLRDVRCVFKFSETLSPTEYQFANASLSINEMERGTITDDSAEFIATGSSLRSIVTLGYSAEEYWYGDYTKKSRLDSVMWEEPTQEPKLRVVFYK